MPEHNCGGWCSASHVSRVLNVARKGGTVREVAKAVGKARGTIGNVVAMARKLGCLPPSNVVTPKRGKSTKAIRSVCDWCGDDFIAKRNGAAYCKPACGVEARSAGVEVNEKRTSGMVGPAKAPDTLDEVGIRRRLRGAVESGVDYAALLERFAQHVQHAAIDAEVMRAVNAGLRDCGTLLPLGVPA